MKVENLDILRPEPKMIQIGGKDIDVSFIPCGITFDVDTIIQELQGMSQEELLVNKDMAKRAFDLSIKLCSVFCSHNHPELDEEWFFNNTDANQIKVFSMAIKDALVHAYAGVESNSKNLKAPRKKIK